MTQESFLKDIGNWSNHRPLLWLALEATKGNVLELGCGDGSTPYLQQYCQDTKRHLLSLDSNKEWADKFGASYAGDWSTYTEFNHISVALVDEAPGEHRKVSIEMLHKCQTEIVVVHDSEPRGWNASNYQVRPLFSKFKYAVDIKPNEIHGAWATALSDTIDLTKWIGIELGGYKIIKYESYW